MIKLITEKKSTLKQLCKRSQWVEHTAQEKLGSELWWRVRLPAGERARGRTQRAVGHRAVRAELAFEVLAATHASRACLLASFRLGAQHCSHCRFHLVRDVPVVVVVNGYSRELLSLALSLSLSQRLQEFIPVTTQDASDITSEQHLTQCGIDSPHFSVSHLTAV